MEISKAKIKTYSALAMRKHRVACGLFVAEGSKCVLETLPFFRLEALVATADWLESGLLPEGVDASCVFTATRRQMEQISSLSTAPQVIGVYRMPALEVPRPEDVSDELILVLDGVQDPGNMGTIMRTADWFGIHHIVASHTTVDIFNPKTVQSTMGAIGRVRVCYTDLPPYVEQYKTFTALPVYGTVLDGEPLYSAPLSGAGMIIMGNEGKGISPQVRDLISSPLLIPSYPLGEATVESLNVAMATAITLAEFRRRQL